MSRHGRHLLAVALLVVGLVAPGCGASIEGGAQDPQAADSPAPAPGAPAPPPAGTPDAPGSSTDPPGTVSATPATVAGCAVFPTDNPWNRDVSADPVDANSGAMIAAMNGGTRFLHPDFGSDPGYGIP